MRTLRTDRLPRLPTGRLLSDAERIFAFDLLRGVKPTVAFASAFPTLAAELTAPKLRGKATILAHDPDIVLRMQAIVRHAMENRRVVD